MGGLGGLRAGGRSPVLIMGIVNASPESHYAGSVRATPAGVAAAARRMAAAGADVVDVGAMSTAPYLPTMISEAAEARRMSAAVRAAAGATDLPVSADTCRASVAREAISQGASVINDVTGLRFDPAMAAAIARSGASAVLCAHGRARTGGPAETRRLLARSAAAAAAAGIPRGSIAVDPAIGFFRSSGRGRLFSRTRYHWARRDLEVLASLRSLSGGLPVAVSVSRKSVVGAVSGEPDPARRLAGSEACELAAVAAGADVLRTHDPGPAREAARLAGRPARADKSL